MQGSVQLCQPTHPPPQIVSLLLLAVKQVPEALAQFDSHLRLFRQGSCNMGAALWRCMCGLASTCHLRDPLC